MSPTRSAPRHAAPLPCAPWHPLHMAAGARAVWAGAREVPAVFVCNRRRIARAGGSVATFGVDQGVSAIDATPPE